MSRRAPGRRAVRRVLRHVTGVRLALAAMGCLCLAAFWSVHQVRATSGMHRLWWLFAATVTSTLALAWAGLSALQLRHHRRTERH